MNGIVYQPPWTFRPSCCALRLPIDTCLVSKKFYKSPLTNYVFGVAMGGLLLKLRNFKKVKLIFGHPVFWFYTKLGWPFKVVWLLRSLVPMVTALPLMWHPKALDVAVTNQPKISSQIFCFWMHENYQNHAQVSLPLSHTSTPKCYCTISLEKWK